MTKKELRKQYLERRKQLSEGECAAFNLKLYNLFFASFDLSFIRVLHIYLPIAKNNEPDTWAIIDRIRHEFPHIRLSIPRVVANGELENAYFEGMHQLEKSELSIPEPRIGVPTPDEKIDMVIVPLIAFDEKGNRIGYGKGFYDRFLKRTRLDCKKVGLSFFAAAKEIDDVDVSDVPLDQCVTPSGIMQF
jgi:5-formyltetrahydrofolate cyclo-ligase